jgi:thioredoxin 1
MKKLPIVLTAVMMLFLLVTVDCNAQVSKQKKNKPTPLVTFVELGSVNCIPCKMMKPVMKEVEKAYGDTVSVVFYDVNKERQKSSEYKIRVIPTQVFLDNKGKEFYRHEGFFPKTEIIKLVDKQLTLTRTKTKSK